MTDADRALEAMVRFGTPIEIYTKRCGAGLHYIKEKNSGALIAVVTKKKPSRKARTKYGAGAGAKKWNIVGKGFLAPNVEIHKRFTAVIPIIEHWLIRATRPLVRPAHKR